MEPGTGQAGPNKSGGQWPALRLDVESNRVSADRIWVRRTPSAILCMGMAPSEKLARFALCDDGDDPFFSLCRQIEHEVARGKIAKANQLGLKIPRYALTEPPLRRLAIATSLLRAGFNPDEPRDERGRWTSDGSQARIPARTHDQGEAR